MSNIIELSTGHVFAAGSVKAISPKWYSGDQHYCFNAIGVGFVVKIEVDAAHIMRPAPHFTFARPMEGDARKAKEAHAKLQADFAETVRREAISKLLGERS